MAGVSKTTIHLSIDGRNVSGKTVIIKKGKKKKLRAAAFKKKKLKGWLKVKVVAAKRKNGKDFSDVAGGAKRFI